MKNRLIKVLKISLIMVFIFNITLLSVEAADEDLKVTVNGELINFTDAKPFINADGRTLVPVRFIAENLKCKVEWNGEIREVKIISKDKEIKLNIGQAEAYVNNEKITFDTEAIIKDDRTFVPLRLISEALGAKIEWKTENRTVSISTKNVEDNKEANEDFIEPIFEIKPTKASTDFQHCFFIIKNSKEYLNSGDEYRVSFIVLTHDEMNTTYEDVPSGWSKTDLTQWRSVNKGLGWWDFRKVYLKDKDWDKKFKTEVGMEIELKVILRNESKNIQKEYIQKVKAIESLWK